MPGPSTDPRGTAAAVPTRRGTEAVILGFAVFLSLVAPCIVDLAITGSLRPELLTFGLWISALWLAAQLVVRRWAAYADPLLLPAVALLVGLGLAVIHRLDLAGEQRGSTGGRADAPVQLIWATLGTVLFVGVLALVRDHRSPSRYAYTLALVGIGLLALPALLPASLSEVHDAKIWIRLLGGVTDLLPLTGLTTPFVADGVSSLVANFVLVAVLVRISDAARRPATPQATPQPRLGDAPTEIVQQ